VPQITQLEAEPSCDVITSHDDGDYLEVRFFARASGGNVKSDPTGANSPLDWTWDFGDGSTATNIVNPTHRYTQPGDYDVVVTVKDNDGDPDTRNIRIVVGASFSDLDVLTVTAERVSDSRLSFTRDDSLSVFSGWATDFDGHLLTPCPISGLYRNYHWEWEYNDGSPVDDNVSTPTHVFPPTAASYQIVLTVTENNTQVSRSDTTSTDYPAGLRLANTARILLPGTSFSLELDGLLTQNLDRIDAEFSWPAELEISASAVASSEITAQGFTLDSDNSVPGVLALSFQAPSGMPLTDAIIPFAQVTFSRPTDTVTVPVGTLNVELSSITVHSADGSPRAGSGIGGDLEIDNDCDANLVADRFQPDCNENGVADFCDIRDGTVEDCNENGVPDVCDIADGTSQDCNRNKIPDECEIAAGSVEDCDNDGVPDECQPDCNFNGISDVCDIRDGTSVDCDNNGIPDECQPDCNENGIADACDIRDDTSVDCDENGIPDECEPDCNGNGIADRCDTDPKYGGEFPDCNGNFIPDECETDCNFNGIPDDCDIKSGTSVDLNRNGIPDECE
jgi:PKD repeat protein